MKGFQRFLLCLVLALLSVFSCGENANVAGNGSNEGNAKGRLIRCDGSPAAGATVRFVFVDHNPVTGIAKAQGSVESATTDGNGYFGLFLNNGTYNMFGDGDSILSFSDSIETGDTDIVLVDTLKRPGRIEGSILMPGLYPVDQVRVTIYSPGTEFYTKPAVGGAFAFRHLPEGTYTFIFDPTLDDYHVKVLTVSVRAGSTTNLGTVVLYGPSGMPAPNAGADRAVSINDTVLMRGGILDGYHQIVEKAWDIGNTGNFALTVAGETSFVAPDSVVSIVCVFRVKDNGGEIKEDSVVIRVVRDAPVVGIAGDSTVQIRIPAVFAANISQQFGRIEGYQWDNSIIQGAIDGAESTYTCTFDEETTATLTLTVTDDDGNTAVATKTVRAVNSGPAITGLRDTSITIKDTIAFSVEAGDLHGIVAEYFWDFDDGSTGQYDTTSTGIVSHTFPSQAGRCTVAVTVKDSLGNSSKATAVVTVLRDAPWANAEADTAVSINDTFEVHLKGFDTLGHIVRFRLDIGSDGVFEDSSDTEGQMKYQAPAQAGEYRVILQVEDDDGNKTNDTLTVSVIVDPPSVNAGDPMIALANQTVQLSGMATDGYGSITKWEWDIGNTGTFTETSSGTFSTTIASAPDGALECVLRVTDDDGNKVTDTLFIFVERDFVREISGKMVRIPAGFFVDDVDSGWAGDTAFVSHDFWMDTTEVTQEDFEGLMGYNPAVNDNESFPIENISWFTAIMYCNARSKAEGKDTAYTFENITGTNALNLVCHWERNGYRLPTEDEWEIAARGGQQYQYASVDGTVSPLCTKANIGNCNSKTLRTASFTPNPYGIYDLSGNVEEFVWNYGDFLNKVGRVNRRTDFSGQPENGSTHRIVKGETFGSTPRGVGYRNSDEPANRWSVRGFRAVRNAE